MNAQLRVANHDANLLDGSSKREPTSEEIEARAEYLKPLIRAKHPNKAVMFGTWATTTTLWDQFTAAVESGDQCEAGRIAGAMFDDAIEQEAEDLADHELYERANWSKDNALRQMGVNNISDWLRRRFL